MAKLGLFKLGSSWLGALRAIGRSLKPRLFTRSYRDVSVEAKTYFDTSVEAKTYRDVATETREVEP
jgi:hypothetical protein